MKVQTKGGNNKLTEPEVTGRYLRETLGFLSFPVAPVSVECGRRTPHQDCDVHSSQLTDLFLIFRGVAG